MEDKELGKKVVSGIKWKAFERIFLQVINAVTPMVLARLLLPEDFGSIAILTVFISIANTFVNNGLANAIIQKKDSDEIDSSTVFYTQVIIAVLCYIVLFAISPLIGKFYNDNSLVLMLRVMSLTIVIGSLGSMQITMMKKNMEFHKSFIIYGSATVAYGIVGIGMAYGGFGCWSLVWANLANSIVMRLASMAVVRWKPKLVFSFIRLKTLFSYSWKLMVGWLIGTLHQDLYTIIIGKRFSPAVLGYYNRAGSFPQIITKTATEVVDGVMFPALSQLQNDREKLKESTKKLLSLNSYVLFPLFFGLSACSANLIEVVLTKKWLPSAPMMSIVCITYALNALNNSNMQVFNSMGRSDVFMKLELVKRSVSIILLLVTSFINIYAVIIVLLLMAVLSNIVNIYNNKKLLDIPYREILRCVIPPIILSGIMWSVAYIVGRLLCIGAIWELLIQVLLGIVIYVGVSLVTKNESYMYILEEIKKITKRA